jgi:hypothetical protein
MIWICDWCGHAFDTVAHTDDGNLCENCVGKKEPPEIPFEFKEAA